MDTNFQIYKLKHPFEWAGDQITELKVRKPTIGDIKHMKLESQNINDILILASKLTAQSEKVIDKLSIDDGLALTELVGNFLGGSRKTGSTESEL